MIADDPPISYRWLKDPPITTKRMKSQKKPLIWIFRRPSLSIATSVMAHPVIAPSDTIIRLCQTLCVIMEYICIGGGFLPYQIVVIIFGEFIPRP